MDAQSPRPVAAAPFDAFVAQLLCRPAGRATSAVRAVYDRWVAGRADGGTFLDYLTARGVVDRVAARAVLMAWQGGLDDRDARQLLDPDAVARAATRLAPTADDLPPPPAWQPGTFRAVGSRLGRYPVKGVLGWGGFGPVYLGVHPTLRVPVALKPVTGTDVGARDRLRAEARRLAAVCHAHIVRIWDYEDGDEPFLVLEYVAGQDLRDRLADGPLALSEAFVLVTQLALGLRAALRAGVTHHDVKPANVLLAPDNGFKVGDFGLARCRRRFARAVPADAPRPPAAAAGTPNYMAPEQFEGCHDHRADVYSLGLTLHHALTGRVPVPGADPDEVMLRHKRGEVDPVHRVAPGVPRAVSDLVGRMTAVDPARRPDTYEELIRAAESAFGMRLDPY